MNNLSPVEAHELQAKALAFDCIQAIEQQQTNLRLLQARIVELAEKTKEK